MIGIILADLQKVAPKKYLTQTSRKLHVANFSHNFVSWFKSLVG